MTQVTQHCFDIKRFEHRQNIGDGKNVIDQANHDRYELKYEDEEKDDDDDLTCPGQESRPLVNEQLTQLRE